MAKLSIKPGSTDVTLLVFAQDSTSTTGAGKTGLAYNTASLTCYYARPGATAAALTLVTQTVTGAHSDGGFVEVDATNMPGVYRLDLSDAVVAAGVRSAVVMLKGATGLAPLPLEIDLNTEVNTTHLGGTAQTGRDIGASVLVGDKTGFSLADSTSDAVIADAVWNAPTASYGSGGTYGEKLEAQDTSSVTVSAINANTVTASAVADDAASEIASAVWAATTRQLTNAQLFDLTGSISGSVGSVTGNVGGNVNGSVGSIASGGIAGTSFVAGAINANAIATNAITSDEIAATACDKIADAILDRNMATGTDSGSATVRTPRQALRFLRNKWSTSGTTLTVTKEDDSTTSWAAELTSSASAEPITAVDPASS